MAKRGAVLCSSCGRLVSAREKTCPYCGAAHPTLFGFAPSLRGFFRDRFDPVWIIYTLCVGLYVASLALDPMAALEMGSLFDLGSPSMRAAYQLGMTSRPAMEAGLWWTLLTAVFLHGSLLHIFFNLSWVRGLGPLAAELFGPARFFVLFCLTGMAGFLASNWISGGPTLGASGAIFGMYGALLSYGRRRGGTWGAGVSRQALAWAVAGFVFSLAMPNVNNIAHGGGFVAGLVLGRIMPYAERRKEARGAQILALILLAGLAISVIASFVVVSRIST